MASTSIFANVFNCFFVFCFDALRSLFFFVIISIPWDYSKWSALETDTTQGRKTESRTGTKRKCRCRDFKYILSNSFYSLCCVTTRQPHKWCYPSFYLVNDLSGTALAGRWEGRDKYYVTVIVLLRKKVHLLRPIYLLSYLISPQRVHTYTRCLDYLCGCVHVKMSSPSLRASVVKTAR